MLHITPQERAALQLLANRKATATNEIAGLLGIGESEVEAHLTTLFARMGAAGRTEAVAVAFRRGLLRPDPATSGQLPAEALVEQLQDTP